MSDPQPPQKKPRKAAKKAPTAAPSDDPKLGPTLPAFQAETLMQTQVDQPPQPPPTDPALIAERDRLLAEQERLRAELAKAALELHQWSIIPFGAPQPPPGPVPAGDLVKVLAMNVKLARVELGLSQDELAAVSGIGRKQISAIENGANTTIETIERLARHLKRTPAELLTKRH